MIVEIISLCFQQKIVKFEKHKHRKSKWITSGIIRSIAYRDKLYTNLKYLNVQDPQYSNIKTNLKTYNCILRKSIRHAKKLYYEKYFAKYKSDIKKTWGMINSIIGQNNYISDKQKIADAFQ